MVTVQFAENYVIEATLLTRKRYNALFKNSDYRSLSLHAKADDTIHTKVKLEKLHQIESTGDFIHRYHIKRLQQIPQNLNITK